MKGFNLQHALRVMRQDELPLWTAADQRPEDDCCGDAGVRPSNKLLGPRPVSHTLRCVFSSVFSVHLGNNDAR